MHPAATAEQLSLRGDMKRGLHYLLAQNETPNAQHALRLLTGALLITVSTVLYVNPPTQEAVPMVRVLHRASFCALVFSYVVTALCAFRWRWKWHQEVRLRGSQ